MQQFGRYQLIEHLASGGMADVYRAQVPGAAGFLKEVAIKVIRPGFSDRSDFIQMFIQEARLASKLSHANIVQVFDFDQVDGSYYIAMEYVHGRTLLEVMDACYTNGVPLGLPLVVSVGIEIASALSYAHRLTDQGQALGLVHRDVSPQNVLISFEGEVKLADFGIAHALGSGGLTAPGTVKGKAAYMAPEQARAERVDARADVFALGTMLWELCTGTQPFLRDTDTATILAVLGPKPVLAPPSSLNPAVIPKLDDAIIRAMARDREKRTATAKELADELTDILHELTTSSKDTDLRQLMHRLWPDGTRSPKRNTAVQKPGLRGTPGSSLLDAGEAVPRNAVFGDSASRPFGPVTPVPSAGIGEVIPRTMVLERTPAGSNPERSRSAERGSPGPEPDGAKPRSSKRLLIVGVVAGITIGLGVAVAVSIRASGGRSQVQAPAVQEPKPAREAPGPPPPGALNRKSDQGESPAQELPPPPAVLGPTVEPPKATEAKRPAAPERARPSKTKPTRGEPRVQVPKTPVATGEGTLNLNPEPWAIVFVDGRQIGFSPQTIAVPAGRHRVRAERENFAPVDGVVVVEPGELSRWLPRLKAR